MINQYATNHQWATASLHQQGTMGVSTTINNVNCPQPVEPSVIRRATELLNFVDQLSDEIGQIGDKIYRDPRGADGIPDSPDASVLSLDELISMACTKAACALGECRTINSRL